MAKQHLRLGLFATSVFALLSLTACSVFSLDTDDEISEFDLIRWTTHDGFSRSFRIHLPPNWEDDGLPLLIMLHGSGGSSEGIKAYTGFDDVADELGFIVVYPDAVNDWAEDCDCSDADRSRIDDLGFILHLINILEDEYSIDRDRVTVSGFSQGGLMAQMLACHLSDSLAGVAPVGATMSLKQWASCTPTSTIPMLMVLGTEDPYFPWDGLLDLGTSSVVSADSTLALWRDLNGCTGDLNEELLYTGPETGIQVYHNSYTTCDANGDVDFYRLEGAGHIWPQGGWSATWTIGRFVDANVR